MTFLKECVIKLILSLRLVTSNLGWIFYHHCVFMCIQLFTVCIWLTYLCTIEYTSIKCYFWIRSTFNITPFKGTNSMLIWSISIGTSVALQTLKRKCFTSIASPTLVCNSPNLMPMQIRGPSPKGKYAYGWRMALASSVNRSGSKTSGFGKMLGSWWKA